MNSEDVMVINELVGQVDEREVLEAEEVLDAKFPVGYKDFIIKFGEGAMTDIRIYPPRRILNGDNNLREWRKRTAEYWFWDLNPEILTKEKALECIIIADTFDGDELVFHSQNPETIYFLPRHDDNIYKIDGGFYEALDWYCNSGILIQTYEERNFESFDSRKFNS
jgi:hypothetical protein